MIFIRDVEARENHKQFVIPTSLDDCSLLNFTSSIRIEKKRLLFEIFQIGELKTGLKPFPDTPYGPPSVASPPDESLQLWLWGAAL